MINFWKEQIIRLLPILKLTIIIKSKNVNGNHSAIYIQKM